MSSWQKCWLGSTMEIIGGGTPKTSVAEYWGGDIPWLSVVDFNTGLKFVSSTEKTITQKGFDNSSTKLLNKGDIIISARGTVGVLAILEKPMAFNQSCYGIRSKEGVSDTNYLYYLLTNTVRELTQISHGGVFDTITRATFDEIEIELPTLPEQKAIASVLSSLDDKIDLLHRQNKTLEAMAETLFRQWFIEDAKEDWVQGKVEDIFVLQRGYDLPSSKRIKGDYPLYAASGLNDNINAYQVEYPTVITGRSGSIGGVYISLEKSWPLNTTLFIKEFKLGTLIFSYFYLKYLDLESFNSGSAVPSLNRNHVHGLEIQLPPEKLVNEYEEIAQDWMLKVKANKHQIQTLEQLRDTLLPKLMSGEVRVQYQTEEVA
jgi:type I restriction enzyme S subunit